MIEMAPPKSPPRHTQIAERLRADIQSGVYVLGARLPIEAELVTLFDTSRPTLRQALATLTAEGLIVRRPRTGSVVVATRMPVVLSHAVTSVNELLDYPRDTHRKVTATCYLKADAGLAQQLHCPAGKAWFQITTLRYAGKSTVPLCWTDTYVLPKYAGVTKHRRHTLIPVCEQIVELYDEVIEQADIEIFVMRVPKRMAAALKAPADSPAMGVMRTYTGRDDEVFQTTVSVHPEERYRYRFELKREARAAGWQRQGSGIRASR
jgi:DNA-binding GntR family transcriptional regulator